MPKMGTEQCLEFFKRNAPGKLKAFADAAKGFGHELALAQDHDFTQDELFCWGWEHGPYYFDDWEKKAPDAFPAFREAYDDLMMALKHRGLA